MKTSLTTLSLILAAGFPGSLLAALAGFKLPAVFDVGNTFGLFVAVLTLLTAFSDYACPSVRSLASNAGAPAAPPTARTASLAPAATEERRLAA